MEPEELQEVLREAGAMKAFLKRSDTPGGPNLWVNSLPAPPPPTAQPQSVLRRRLWGSGRVQSPLTWGGGIILSRKLAPATRKTPRVLNVV